MVVAKQNKRGSPEKRASQQTIIAEDHEVPDLNIYLEGVENFEKGTTGVEEANIEEAGEKSLEL